MAKNRTNPYTKIELVGTIAKPPELIQIGKYTKKTGLELILKVDKVRFYGKPCVIPSKIPMAFDAIIPIFKGNKVMAKGIVSNGNYKWTESLEEYFLKNSNLYWFPNSIKVLDKKGRPMAIYKQDTSILFEPSLCEDTRFYFPYGISHGTKIKGEAER